MDRPLASRLAMWPGLRIFDNALFGKDVAQWTHGKALVTQLYLLLGLGALITTFFSMAFLPLPIMPSGTVAPVAFWALMFTQTLIIIGIMMKGHGSATEEFRNKTFETLELSGLSVERIVLGKLLFMATRFFLAYACLLPFMTSCLSWGGLDLLTFCVAIVGLPFLVLPALLLALWTGMANRGRNLKEKRTGTNVGRVILVIFLVLFVLPNFMGLFFVGVSGTSFGGAFFSGLDIGLGLFSSLGLYAVVYILLCLLLFYLACGAICPLADSRDMAKKFLTFLLVFLWLFIMVGLIVVSGGTASPWIIGVIFVPMTLLICLMGVAFFHGPGREPAMAAARRRNARGLSRLAHHLFTPGVDGARRTILLFCAMSALSGGALLSLSKGHFPLSSEVVRHVAVVLQTPFFIVFPVGLLAYMRTFRERRNSLRNLTVGWWLLVGGLLGGVALVLPWMSGSDSTTQGMVGLGALFLSPVSTYFAPKVFEFGDAEVILRLASGGLGVFFLFAISRWHVKPRRRVVVPANRGEEGGTPTC